MPQWLGIAVIILLGYYLYHELYGTPSPLPLPEIITAHRQESPAPDSAPPKPGEGGLPSSYDPAYIHPESLEFAKPFALKFRPSERAATWAPTDAPVQCGPYFLYYHPSYWKQYQPHERVPRIITVSKTPPDADVEKIEQLWAFSIRLTHDNSYPVVRKNEIIAREDLRPVMVMETLGVYVGGHTCLPYKPTELTCASRSPWC